MKGQPAVLRFWSKVLIGDGCWEWQGSLSSRHGLQYGSFFVTAHPKRVTARAHRWSYEWAYGPIPADLELDHKCRNTKCVRFDHLEPVTHQVNVLRGSSLFAKKAAQTHCIQGHEYTPENTYNRKSRPRLRECIACRIERDRKRCTKGPVPAKTHCIRGHEFTPENTYWWTNSLGTCSQRQCRACWAARRVEKRSAQTAATI